MTDKPGISVIVCCFNSAFRIEETLKHLAEQIVPHAILWEIIIVNNNSVDDTESKAKKVWANFYLPVSFTMVNEPLSGLSHARKKGIETSKFAYLLFCDDDNWLEKNYVQRAYKIMSENGNIGILAGQSVGYFETEKPDWFSSVEAAYAVGKPLPQKGVANSRHYLAGAGFIIRKTILNELSACSFQPVLTGRRGSKLTSGEDGELCLLAQFLGYDLYYDDSLLFTHYLPAQRLTWKYCIAMCSGHARPQVYFYLYKYCFTNIMQENEIHFQEAFNRFWIKHTKSLLKDFFGLKIFFDTLNDLLFSKPGSVKKIATKKKIVKILYALKNKNDIRNNFKNIVALAYKMKERAVKYQSTNDPIEYLP